MEKMNFILSICQDTIKEKNLLLIIDDIYKNIASVYDDIRESSIESATQAIHSAYTNKDQNFNVEIFDAIAHLRFAFYLSKESLGLKRKYSYLFGLMTGYKDLLDYSAKLLIEDCLCGLSSFIAILYREVGKIEISEEWIDISIKYYKKNINYYYDFSPENIQKEHPNFVHTKYGESEEVVETNHITGDYMTITKEYEYLALTIEGEEYVKQEKKNKIISYANTLRSIKII